MQQSPGRRRLLPPAHPALVREERRGLRRRAADQQPRCGAGRTGRRVRLLMSRSHPNRALYRRVAALAAQPP